MPEIRHLTAADARRVPWKNGRGVTEELALWPPGASFERGDFDWRIARAGVDAAGPFSVFAGFDRVLVVTAGAGLVLRHGGREPPMRVLPLQPHAFSGDEETSAEPIDGSVQDLNVLFRRGVVRADVSVRRIAPPGGCACTGGTHLFVHVLAGAAQARRARATSTQAIVLASGESLQASGTTPADEFEFTAPGGATLVIVRIDQAGG